MMKSLLQIIALVIGVNALVALLFLPWVYDDLDNYLYGQLNRELIEVKTQVDSALNNIQPAQWQQKAMELGIDYETQATIERISSLDIDISVLSQIKPGKGTIIDETMPMLYYALDDNQVMVIGPLSSDSALVYFTEWVSWLAGMIVSTSVLLLILVRRQNQWQKLREVLTMFPDMEAHKDKSLETLLVKLHQSQAKQFDEQQRRLTSQRDLLHGVAHEFRSPMARMQFALDMLADCPEDERHELIVKIEKSLGDLDDLVKELLYYSRLKHEQDPLHLTWIPLNEAVSQAVETVAHFYPHVAFEHDINENALIHADKALIKRLLVNLMRNAGRFSESLCRVSANITDTAVKLCIEDDGPGIPPGKQARIFEPFTRLDPSRSRDSGGCGLGLAIVDSIIHKHNADISVGHSELGGASFTMIFPR